MDFNYFKNKIETLSQISVGGLEAQFKLAPKFRAQYSKNLVTQKNPKKAAVVALFYPNAKGETSFLLTLRASYNGTHSAQISFPGGKFEKSDTSLKQTAIREANEEVGVEKNDIGIFKQMTNVYIPPSNFLVTPFLGLLKYEPIFTINNEVEKIITISLKDLLKETSISKTMVTTSYAKNVQVPCFVLNNYTVWGATAMMLSEIRALLKNI